MASFLCSCLLCMVLQVASTGSSPQSGAEDAIIKGVSYGPIPLRSGEGAGQLPADDWFCDEAVHLWGKSGRGDLKVIRQLGANMVRLYGNNPKQDHTSFLDEAHMENLSVAPGMSDFPYYQDMAGNCKSDTNFDCFSQVKPLYAQNLQNGFLTLSNEYHPALKYMNILNEPDLKMGDVMQMCRSIISAFDAMLDAEKDAGVTGPLINYTATFSFAICGSCEWHNDRPALGQIAQLDDAMRNPSKYGYSPRNDITAAYKARFTHSINTQNPARDLQYQFLDPYLVAFPTTPVYIGEYHRVGANQTEDLSTILDIARAHPLFLGISFFQYQVAYWKGGSELNFGMFGLGDYIHANMSYFSKVYPIYCLVPVESPESNISLPAALTQAYGGPGVEEDNLCRASPWAVPLDHRGFAEIAVQQSLAQMERFIRRFVHHMGATVGDEDLLPLFANRFVGTGSDAFAVMASELGSRPGWLEFDSDARCMANRDAEPRTLGEAIGWACANSPSLNCSSVPEECQSDPYRFGDYVFSRYFARHGDTSDPVLGCSFGGAAIFAPTKLFSAWTGASACAAATTTTATSSTLTSTETTRTRTTTTLTESTTSAASHRDSHPSSFLGTSPRTTPGWPAMASLAGLALALRM